MLCNELFDLMKEEREGFEGVTADCVDLDIHVWRVRVSDVDKGCPLYADLQALQQRHGAAAMAASNAAPADRCVGPRRPVLGVAVGLGISGYATRLFSTHLLVSDKRRQRRQPPLRARAHARAECCLSGLVSRRSVTATSASASATRVTAAAAPAIRR